MSASVCQPPGQIRGRVSRTQLEDCRPTGMAQSMCSIMHLFSSSSSFPKYWSSSKSLFFFFYTMQSCSSCTQSSQFIFKLNQFQTKSRLGVGHTIQYICTCPLEQPTPFKQSWRAVTPKLENPLILETLA